MLLGRRRSRPRVPCAKRYGVRGASHGCRQGYCDGKPVGVFDVQCLRRRRPTCLWLPLRVYTRSPVCREDSGRWHLRFVLPRLYIY